MNILYQSINQYLCDFFVPLNSESFDLRIYFTISFSALLEMYLLFVFIYIFTYFLSYMYLFNIPFQDVDQDMYLSGHFEICICHFVIWNRDTCQSLDHAFVRPHHIQLQILTGLHQGLASDLLKPIVFPCYLHPFTLFWPPPPLPSTATQPPWQQSPSP